MAPIVEALIGWAWRLLGNVLMVLNVLALIILVLEPYLPQPGSQAAALDFCLDVGAWPPAVRLDRKLVRGGGPCWELSAAWVAGVGGAAGGQAY